MRVHRPSVLRHAWWLLRDRDLAETVTQDCFLRAFKSRALYRGQCSVRTWLLAIATNLVRDNTRTHGFRFWKQVRSSAVDVYTMESRLALPPANRGGGDAYARKVAAHLGHGGRAAGEATNHIHASFCRRDAGSGDSRDHRTKPEHGQKPSLSCSSYGPRSDGKRRPIFGGATAGAESDGAESIGRIVFFAVDHGKPSS
jgi:hypothetical protein